MPPIIECNELKKSFRGIRALDGLNLTVTSNTTTGLVGPNGAGKTTFFSLLTGFLNVTSGTIRVMGHHPNASALKGHIGILPQDTPFMKGIDVQSQLTLHARLHGFKKQAAEKESQRVLELLDVLDLVKQYPETLSFGQRKRVTIAQALIGQPELILLDEPTSGLDPLAANEVRKLIQQLSDTSMFMVSSHNLDEIEDICAQIILIDKGKLVRHCAISELTEQNNYLTLLLDQRFADGIKVELNQHPEISAVESDTANPNRVSINFRSDAPDQLQIKILEIFQKHGIGVIEFSRGAILTDKVIDLVKDH